MTVVDPALTGQIALRASRLSPSHGWPGSELGITQRESDVLRAIVDGLNNRAVAEKLFVSEDTVKTHVRSIFRKRPTGPRRSPWRCTKASSSSLAPRRAGLHLWVGGVAPRRWSDG
jgi:DNA-binding CsgD family transcriptional regulator